MEIVYTLIVILANWMVVGSLILDVKTGYGFSHWKARRSVKKAALACLFWPLMCFHLSHTGAKF